MLYYLYSQFAILCRYTWEGHKGPGTQAYFAVKRICIKPSLTMLKILPFCTYTHAPRVLPFLEAPMELPF
jgi:hypothetical protein